jgi:hypothetical protein
MAGKAVGRAARALLACAGALACACAGDPSDLPTSLSFGTSDVEPFEELVPGGEIKAIRGLQGGFHVVLGIRATGIDPDKPIVDLDVRDLDTNRNLDRFAPLALPLTLTPDEDAYELRPRVVVLDITSLDDVHDHRLRVSAIVTDKHGARVERAIDTTCVAEP